MATWLATLNVNNLTLHANGLVATAVLFLC